jgi:hypothetical protein
MTLTIATLALAALAILQVGVVLGMWLRAALGERDLGNDGDDT